MRLPAGAAGQARGGARAPHHQEARRAAGLLPSREAASPEAETCYCRYHIRNHRLLELEPGKPYPLQRTFQNRHIENLFREYASIKFFLGKENIREVLLLR